jgi:D-serine deaminase-like pyridoxal phosphate-dependent protein
MRCGTVNWPELEARSILSFYPVDMDVSEIDTPALVVDLDIFERNLRRVAEYARNHSLRLRPHAKTHKSVWIGERQLALGAAGLTVAKVSEAEIMAEADPRELLLAFPIVGRAKLSRLMDVARRTRVTVALDSAEAARQLSEASTAAGAEIGVLAETDVGLGRVGVAPGEPLLELARAIDALPNLRFEGVTFYPGHIKSLDGAGRWALAKLSELLSLILEDFRRAGIEVKIVSGGSTPTLFHSHEIAGLNEIRPGTYVFNDINTVSSGACGMEDCAAGILATVVSTARPGHMIIDGGSKTFSSDRPVDSRDVSFGHIVEAPGARFHKMNEEHGFVDLTEAGREFRIGERVHVIPNHICVAVNLHEKVYGVRGETVERVWSVEARGKLQ